MERYQADTEQELNMRFKETVGGTTNRMQICSNKEAARLVRGSEDEEAVNWVIAQRNKMEKTAAVRDCERGDVVTTRGDTNNEDKPIRVVQGTITGIPNTTLSQFRQKTVHEVITLDANEYQVSRVISITIDTKKTPTDGETRNDEMQETNSPISTKNTGKTAPSTPERQRKQKRRQEANSPSFRNDTRFQNNAREEGSYSYSDSADMEPIPMSPPAVPMGQPGSTPNSPTKSAWSGGSMAMASATSKELEKHNAPVAKAHHLKIAIEKADVRTEDGRQEFRETWRQVASPAYMHGPTIPLWSLATLLKKIAPLGHTMSSVVDEPVEENNQNPGMFEFRAGVDTEGSEQGSFKKRICNRVYEEMTRAPWEDMVKVEKRNLWKKVRLTEDQSLLREHLEQVATDLREQAAFSDRRRFEQAVSSTISRVGWKTRTSIIQNAAAIRTVFASENTAEGRAGKFREGILKMYSGVLTMHQAAITFCINESELIGSAYNETVKWLTADYIRDDLYNKILMRSKKQGGLEQQRYGRGGQNRSATKSTYTAQRVAHDNDYELADVLRQEGVSSERRRNGICDSFHEEVTATEEGHDTLYNEKGKSHSAQGTNIRNTIMNVEGKIAAEERTFFRAQEDRPERPQGLSYGSRGQPKPDPESTESMEYCKQINWS